jgi:hypothetical protein
VTEGGTGANLRVPIYVKVCRLDRRGGSKLSARKWGRGLRMTRTEAERNAARGVSTLPAPSPRLGSIQRVPPQPWAWHDEVAYPAEVATSSCSAARAFLHPFFHIIFHTVSQACPCKSGAPALAFCMDCSRVPSPAHTHPTASGSLLRIPTPWKAVRGAVSEAECVGGKSMSSTTAGM